MTLDSTINEVLELDEKATNLAKPVEQRMEELVCENENLEEACKVIKYKIMLALDYGRVDRPEIEKIKAALRIFEEKK